MMKKYLLAGAVMAMLTFSACSDDTFDFGNTLTQNADKLSISTNDFVISDSMKTVLANSVLLRSSHCFLGRVKDTETGAYIASELTTQFNILNSFSLQNKEKVVSIFNGEAAADNCQIELYLSEPTGVSDTLAALKIRLSELDVPLEENMKYYSDYDPQAEGKVRKDGLIIDKMFSYNDLSVPDTTKSKSNYYPHVVIRMDKPYVSKSGKQYNNYGSYLMDMYYNHHEYFKNSYTFTHNVCPGFVISVLDGEGVYTEVPDICIRFYYKAKDSKDSIITYNAALAGTEEILQTTKIENEKEVLEFMASIDTCTYVKSPAGLYTEVKLPIEEIFQGHENDSIMTAKVSFQRINNEIKDKTLSAPPHLMMIEADSITTFFEKKKLIDNISSFYASYSTSSGTANLYTFSNISNLITKLKRSKEMGMKQNPDWLSKHPNWDKVLLVPIQLKTSTTSVSTNVTGIEHYVGITSTKLVGGKNNRHDPVKLNIVYGKFNQ